MKNFRQTLAAVIAAATATSCLAAVASAETEEYKLLVAPFSTYRTWGGDLTATTDGDTLISVSDEDIANWQKTGEFTYTELTPDFEMPENLSYFYGDNNVGWIRREVDGKPNLKIVNYDAESKTITTKNEFDDDWTYVFADGTVIYFAPDKYAGKLSVTITTADGKSNTKTFEYKGSGEMFYNYACNVNADVNSKYIAAVLWMTNVKAVPYEEGSEQTLTAYAYDIYGITKDGKVDTLYSEPEYEYDVGFGTNRAPVVSMGYLDVNDHCMSWMEECAPMVPQRMIYSLETGKIVKSNVYLSEYDVELKCKYTDGEYYSEIDGVTGMWGNKFIAECPVDETSDTTEYRYILFSFEEEPDSFNDDFTPLSKVYKHISSEDGKIFLVETEDDKWGFIDENGKELAIFDDASAFLGNYAPVVKDGKAYIIDKNMNRVSEMIDADGVYSVKDNVFYITRDGEYYLATFDLTDPDVSIDTPDTSSNTSGVSSDTTSNTEDDDKKNPPTGGAYALMLAVAAAAGTAVVVSRKKK